MMSGINISADDARLNSSRVDYLQKLYLNLGQAMIQKFGINPNTKVQKLMRHLKDQLRDLGSVMWPKRT